MSEPAFSLLPITGVPRNFQLFYSPAANPPAGRLVVFVHGFGGSAVKTWRAFYEGQAAYQWWRGSDLVFVGYSSLHDEVGYSASALRNWLARAYPSPELGLLPTRQVDAPYDQLVLVGHSLGGVVLRMLLLEELRAQPNSPLLQATLLLFSPAIGGFVPSGLLGAFRELGLWAVVEAILSGSPAYNVLRKKTDDLAHLRADTEQAAKTNQALRSLSAWTLWASPDGVVATGGYATDRPPEWEQLPHMRVCKPHVGYTRPWEFIEEKAR